VVPHSAEHGYDPSGSFELMRPNASQLGANAVIGARYASNGKMVLDYGTVEVEPAG
jgi:uncharacterized protein YbjQ (UPF0145 family)